MSRKRDYSRKSKKPTIAAVGSAIGKRARRHQLIGNVPENAGAGCEDADQAVSDHSKGKRLSKR